MKNKFLLLLILGVVFFASCSDDDKDPFKNYSADYSGDKLALKLNGKEFAGTSVSFNSKNKKNATLTLNKLIPGEPALEVTNLVVEELTGDDYTFAGESKNDDRTLLVEGSVKSGVLSLSTNFKVTSKVAGEWMLAKPEMDEDGNLVSGGVHLEIVTDIDVIKLPVFGEIPINLGSDDEISLTSLITTLGGSMLPGILTKINLKDDGNLVASYREIDGIDGIFNPDEAPLVNSDEGLVRYNVKDGQIYLLIDIASLLGRSTGNNMDVITAMLETGIPLKLQLEGEKMKAYVDKEMMMPFLPYVSMLKELVVDMEPIDLGFLGKITSDDVQKLIDDIVNLVSTSQSIELGLNLEPYVEEELPQASMLLPKTIEKTILKFAK